MSTRVLIIPEDFRKDQYMLKPIVAAMMRKIGKPKAKITVCLDPLLGGVTEALKIERIRPIIDQYQGMIDIFILCIDRDGKEGRYVALEKLEAEFEQDQRYLFVSSEAWQEIEVWVLAGHDLPTEWVWKDVRAEPHPKELYYEAYVEQRGLRDAPQQGRKILAEEAASNYARIHQLCPEDIQPLELRINEWLTENAS